ncbi:Peptidyl-arginine deiminase, Porphyromonas-type [Penicillium expansum]|nr:Peptidyl-arginine deiminase, Porphyromonas-type [Penicillium expansum]
MMLLERFRKLLSTLYITTRTWLQPSHISSYEIKVQQGSYIFPAESEPHEATIMGVPSRCSLPPDQYDAVCNELAQLAGAITEFEPVRLYVRPEEIQLAESLARTFVKDASRISIIPCPINHCWVRDTGPVYVRDTTGAFPNRRFAINFQFNEWGGKKPEDDGVCWGQRWPLMDDKALQENTDFARWVIEHDREPSPVTQIETLIRAEGGGLVTDGEGTLLITESSVVCDMRNPGVSKAEIETELKRVLGIEKVIWFPGRRNVDITDVHMDAEARFVRPGVIAYSKPHAIAIDLWKELSTEIREILDRETDAKGRRLQIHTIEEPDPRGLVKSEHEELAASYVNFYFVNGGLIIPKFGDGERDQKALEMFQALLPERVIRQVYANAIPLTGGVLHCVTQQVPAMK